jgi:hypothetical protein
MKRLLAGKENVDKKTITMERLDSSRERKKLTEKT